MGALLHYRAITPFGIFFVAKSLAFNLLDIRNSITQQTTYVMYYIINFTLYILYSYMSLGNKFSLYLHYYNTIIFNKIIFYNSIK